MTMRPYGTPATCSKLEAQRYQVQLQAAPAAGPVSDQSHAHGHVHVQADERMLTLTSTH